tara:strand:+ start:383 stop:523 length:141 start_codon:yes stop_codon:yes gene_type:complete
MLQKISAPNDPALTFDVVEAKGVKIPKIKNISVFCLKLCIKLFSFI